MLNWYALYTKPHSELQVERALAADGITTYFPSVPAPRRAGRASVHPYFPCYLFAYADLEVVGISRLNWTPGMRHVVGFAGAPARVDARIIDAIRRRLEQPLALDEQGEMLEHNDRVVITDGPFQDVDAIFDKRLSAVGRVRVLIQMLQQLTAVELEARALRKTGQPPPAALAARSELPGSTSRATTAL
jgi:transcriptional antiterminator RfaH